MIKAVLFGVVAALVGAAAWGGIAYVTNYEIGWIAWGIGLLVGFAVMFGCGSQAGPTSGILAVVLTCLSIVGGKYAAVELTLQKELQGSEMNEVVAGELARFDSDEYVISYLADEVAHSREEAGETVNWPAGVDPREAAAQSDYPADIWAEADARWLAMGPDGQATYRSDRREEVRLGIESLLAEAHDAAAAESFVASFGMFDLLFFGLGAVTAFKVGSSAGESS